MKTILYMLPALLPLLVAAQAPVTTTLSLVTGNSGREDIFPWTSTSAVTFYKLPEDTVMLIATPGKHGDLKVKPVNMPTGHYKLTWCNNFGQLVIQYTQLTDQPETIIFNPDSLVSYPQNTLLKLRNRDSIVINFSSIGCFHRQELKLVISKEAGTLAARLYKVYWRVKTRRGKRIVYDMRDSLLQAATVTPAGRQAFTRFENELPYQTPGKCTTTDWNTMKSRFGTIEKKDSSGSWNGFHYLQAALFNK